MQGNKTLPNQPWGIFWSHKFQTWQLIKFSHYLSYNACKLQITQYLNSQHILGHLHANAHCFGNLAHWCTCVTFVHIWLI
jgi:hypothetical protein